MGGNKEAMITRPSMPIGWNVPGYLACLSLLCCVQIRAQSTPKQVLLSDPPSTRSPLVLTAVNNPYTGKAAFSFDGREDAPVIRVKPGEHIRLRYVNAMSTHSREHCVDGPCMNMTNLHFHGLHVSPNTPQDDVLTTMTMPGMVATCAAR